MPDAAGCANLAADFTAAAILDQFQNMSSAEAVERVLKKLATKKAEEILVQQNPDKEYLPISGLPEFTKAAAKLAYGAESKPLNDNAVRVSHVGSRAFEFMDTLGRGCAIHLRDWCPAHWWRVPWSLLSSCKDNLLAHSFLGKPYSHFP